MKLCLSVLIDNPLIMSSDTRKGLNQIDRKWAS